MIFQCFKKVKLFLDILGEFVTIINMYQAPLLKKIFMVIEALIEGGNGIRLSQISKRTGINRATLYGILLAMQKNGYVVKDKENKTYSISNELVNLARRIIKRADLPAIARPFLERLSQKFEETVFLGIVEKEHIKILDVVEPTQAYKITSPLGSRLPITAGATGKVALSFLSDEEVKELVRKKGLRKYTDKTICDEGEFFKELERVRKLGYALEIEEYIKGVWACAVPVLFHGKMVALIWIVGFTSRFREERIEEVIKELKSTAATISLEYESLGRRENLDGQNTF